MAVNKMKKSITLMMMMVMIMFVVTQVSHATQSIDISTKEFCRRCEMDCGEGCRNFECVNRCMDKKCRCCLTGSPACAKWLKLCRLANIKLIICMLCDTLHKRVNSIINKWTLTYNIHWPICLSIYFHIKFLLLCFKNKLFFFWEKFESQYPSFYVKLNYTLFSPNKQIYRRKKIILLL